MLSRIVQANGVLWDFPKTGWHLRWFNGPVGSLIRSGRFSSDTPECGR